MELYNGYINYGSKFYGIFYFIFLVKVKFDLRKFLFSGWRVSMRVLEFYCNIKDMMKK